MSEEAKETTMKVEKEIQPTGDGARSERQEPGILRELDFTVGEKVMGWFRHAGMMHGKPQDVLTDRNGSTYSVECGCLEDFNPSTNIAAAMQVEDRIAALGLQGQYLQALGSVVAKAATVAGETLGYWHFTHANAEQRCRAAIAALALVDGGGSVMEGER